MRNDIKMQVAWKFELSNKYINYQFFTRIYYHINFCMVFFRLSYIIIKAGVL